MSPRPLIVLTLLSCGTALAQEATYDLRKRYTPQVGDRVQVEETDRSENAYALMRDGKAVERQAGKEGRTLKLVEEVLRVKDDRIADFRKTFGSFQLLDDAAKPDEEQPDVAGLVVTYLEDEQGETKWTASGGVEVPAALKTVLDDEAGPDAGDDTQEQRSKLLAPEPVAVGASWDIPLPFVAEQFQLEPEDLVAEQCSARGTLVSVKQTYGAEMRTIRLDVKLAANKFQGMSCPEPIAYDMHVTLQVSPGCPYGRSEMSGTIKGKAVPDGYPPGVLLQLDCKLERLEIRTPPPEGAGEPQPTYPGATEGQ